MGLASRRKGAIYEREALRLLTDLGLKARRTAASGAQEGYVADIELDIYGGIDIEVKYSSCDSGMRIIRRYMKPVHCVMSRAPGEEWLVSYKQDIATQLMQDAADLEYLEKTHPELFCDGVVRR